MIWSVSVILSWELTGKACGTMKICSTSLEKKGFWHLTRKKGFNEAPEGPKEP
jgi:hypothetical protein